MKIFSTKFIWTMGKCSVDESEKPELMDFEIYKYYMRHIEENKDDDDILYCYNLIINHQRKHFPKETAIYDTLL